MPVGLGIGNVIALGRRQVSGELSAYYSVVHPETQPYPKWLLGFGFTISQAPRE
jgi:hypothetical protein